MPGLCKYDREHTLILMLRVSAQAVLASLVGCSHLASANPYKVLAGDMHCHVAPPDETSDVSRNLPATSAIAKAEGHDFVVLTPHVWSRFYADAHKREKVRRDMRELRDAIARQPSDVLLIAGMEYTDNSYGHVGMAFANLDEVFDSAPSDRWSKRPSAFFEAWANKGGVLTLNHPFNTGLDSMFAIARANMSWRPFTWKGKSPPEFQTVNQLAHGYEAFNVMASEWRDRFLLGDQDASLHATLNQLDREVVRQKRRIAAVGGSDSHNGSMRVTTYVLATERTPEAIRDAIVGGRTCVRDKAACSLRAKSGDVEVGVGGSLHNVKTLTATADSIDVEFFLNGRRVPATTAVPSQCSTLRARVDAGYSSPIYVNCKSLA